MHGTTMHLIPSRKWTQSGIAAHPPRVLQVAPVYLVNCPRNRFGAIRMRRKACVPSALARIIGSVRMSAPKIVSSANPPTSPRSTPRPFAIRARPVAPRSPFSCSAHRACDQFHAAVSGAAFPCCIGGDRGQRPDALGRKPTDRNMVLPNQRSCYRRVTFRAFSEFSYRPV